MYMYLCLTFLTLSKGNPILPTHSPVQPISTDGPYCISSCAMEELLFIDKILTEFLCHVFPCPVNKCRQHSNKHSGYYFMTSNIFFSH